MNEKQHSEKRPIYYGEPTREMQEEIIENIGNPAFRQGSHAITCLRLRIAELKRTADNKIIFPNVCWEKICRTQDSPAHSSGPIEINDPKEMSSELRVRFGDFEQIIEMIKRREK